MGAGSSVRASVPCAISAEDSTAREGKDFDECASLLASKYHDLRLNLGGGLHEDVAVPANAIPHSILKNSVNSPGPGCLSPPLPRAERKRLSRQLRPETFSDLNSAVATHGQASGEAGVSSVTEW